MTPDEYVDRLSTLVAAGRDEEALELAARFDTGMRPHLSPEQLDLVSGMMESAEMAVQIARAVQTLQDGHEQPEAAASSRSGTGRERVPLSRTPPPAHPS